MLALNRADIEDIANGLDNINDMFYSPLLNKAASKLTTRGD